MRKKCSSFIYYYIILAVIATVSWLPYYHLTLKKWLLKILNAIPSYLLIQTFGFEKEDWLSHTWYLSAMIIAVLVLTPILLKYHKTYSLYIAPVLSLFLIGFRHGEFAKEVMGGDNGVLRAFAEISLGCTCYYIVESGILKKLNKNLLSIIALFCYAFSIVLMFRQRDVSKQIEVVVFMVIAISITFYNTDAFSFLNNKFIYFLGKLSLPIYLFHKLCKFYLMKYFPLSRTVYWVCIYLLFVFVLSVVCMFAGDGLRKLCNKMLFKKSEVAA